MAPIRYSLHYEDYSEHLMSRFGKLLQIQCLVDMTLMCSSHTLRVHKAVLAASSAYFQEVLQKQTGEPLIILKMRFSVLKCLVEFMYCGKTQCLEENLDELVSAAHFLKIKGLSKVTKEGLGITSANELPIFSPPVVINGPLQSLSDVHNQDNTDWKTSQPVLPNSTVDMGRPNKDMVVRIPFDIENGGGNGGGTAGDYDIPRVIKPRRGRPSARRSGAWEGNGALGRALLRREQDSRNAIHHLKHLQTRHLQDYMDRVTLSQAVNSICGPESSTQHNYMNLDSDLMYQPGTGSVLDPGSYSKEPSLGPDPPVSYPPANESSNISTAMSQYVNALKSAGLPTDLPILFESGDGSYINVNEQVLLDMVQSSEIQYEVIEQPNIIEKVADPSEIKSIDDLSKSIERGEMMLGSKGFSTDFDKQPSSQYSRHEDAINSLNAILPDNLESFSDQQNYVVLEPPLQENVNAMDPVHATDFSCIDSDMQFFTKAMSEDVKKYYEEQHLNDSRTMEQLCPTSSTLDNNFSISLLDSKCDINSNISQQYSSVNHEDIRRNDDNHEDCYDFDLQLPQSTMFKDPLDCLMDTPKRDDDDREEQSERIEKISQEREEIIKDLMKIEDNITKTRINKSPTMDEDNKNISLHDNVELCSSFNSDGNILEIKENEKSDKSCSMQANDLTWDNLVLNKACDNVDNSADAAEDNAVEFQDKTATLRETSDFKSNKWDGLLSADGDRNTENYSPTDSSLVDDIPFAVGLLPMKQVQPSENSSLLKRKNSNDDNLIEDLDAKCLKRKVKYKK